jgi:hypothetical protein
MGPNETHGTGQRPASRRKNKRRQTAIQEEIPEEVMTESGSSQNKRQKNVQMYNSGPGRWASQPKSEEANQAALHRLLSFSSVHGGLTTAFRQFVQNASATGMCDPSVFALACDAVDRFFQYFLANCSGPRGDGKFQDASSYFPLHDDGKMVYQGLSNVATANLQKPIFQRVFKGENGPSVFCFLPRGFKDKCLRKQPVSLYEGVWIDGDIAKSLLDMYNQHQALRELGFGELVTHIKGCHEPGRSISILGLKETLGPQFGWASLVNSMSKGQPGSATASWKQTQPLVHGEPSEVLQLNTAAIQEEIWTEVLVRYTIYDDETIM